MKPFCFLDVDGVVVLEHPEVPVTAQSVSAFGRWRRDVLVPAAAPAILHRLGQRFDCVWIGAWSYNAHPALRGVLDLPATPWPWIGVQFHKLEAIRAHADGRPWVWIDDDIDDLGAQPDPPDGVLVRVDPRRGIADVDPDALIAASCSAPAPVPEHST